MPERNLPIQFFAHREVIDERRTEGGGGKDYKWLLPDNLLIKKSEQLISELDSFKTTIAERENKQSIIPFVFITRLSDNATAKYKRNFVTKIFDTHRTRSNIIGLLNEEELIIRISTVQELEVISRRIKETGYLLDRNFLFFKPF